MLTLYKPLYEDLWFKQLMLSDEETMSYNHAYGGTLAFPKEKWQNWYTRWITENANKRYYRYLKDESGAFVGEISYHYDNDVNGYMADVIIYAKYRRRGYGSEALELLCSVAKEHGISELYDEIALDNPSVGLFQRHGFSVLFSKEATVVLKRTL